MNYYESIKSKLKKLLALAEGGVDGEAHNARILLERQCKQYGVSIDELLDSDKKEWYEIEIGQRKIDLNLFTQCYCYITGKHSVPYKKISKSIVAVELTAYECAELRSMFTWHKENLRKDLENLIETLFISYCSKHNIMSQTRKEPEDRPRKSLTREEFNRLKAALALQDTLNDNSYFKQLENK